MTLRNGDKGIQQEEGVWYRGENMPLTSDCLD